ncbi:MAG: hypothetical protein J5965_04160 [Aeriscardovia sp.]|nr:hypothetical protein [Aeriscardovia sp.]
MKKSILILTMLAGTITAQADDYPYLTFETSNGEKVSIEFSSDLSLVFSSTTLKVGNQQTFNLKDLKKMYFSPVSQTTGISTVTTDDYKIYGYYDLQGRPVEQPTKGIYVIKTSKGTKKVYVK